MTIMKRMTVDIIAQERVLPRKQGCAAGDAEIRERTSLSDSQCPKIVTFNSAGSLSKMSALAPFSKTVV
jgi:hypothetical protein